MREAAERTQLIVATHSDRFVRFLHPKEVVVMDIDEDGGATATWADSLDLERWLAEYSLDEIWRMGRMGGRA
jgi:predicted ATPase